MTKTLRLVFACAACLLVFAGTASAQDFPTRPVRIVVPTGVGGPSDLVARLLAQKLSEKWGRPVTVENKPGGSTIIGALEVIRARPDGHTLLQTINSTLTITPAMVAKMPYDVQTDFTHIAHVADVPIAFYVGTQTGIASIADLIARAKAQPGGIMYGAGDPSTRLAAETFARAAGIKLTAIQYKGGSEVARALLGGDIQMGVVGAVSGAPFVKSGQFRALATGTRQRLVAHPEIPTMHEAGVPNFEASVWIGFSGPAGIARDVVNRINSDVHAVLQQPDVRDKLIAAGMEPTGGSPEAYVERVREESARFRPLIQELGMKLD